MGRTAPRPSAADDHANNGTKNDFGHGQLALRRRVGVEHVTPAEHPGISLPLELREELLPQRRDRVRPRSGDVAHAVGIGSQVVELVGGTLAEAELPEGVVLSRGDDQLLRRTVAGVGEPQVGIAAALAGCGKSPPWTFSTRARCRRLQLRMTVSTAS